MKNKSKKIYCECGAPRVCKWCGSEYFVRTDYGIICAACNTSSWLGNHHYPNCTCKPYTEEYWYKEMQNK